MKRIFALLALLLLLPLPTAAAGSALGETYFLEWSLTGDLYRGEEKLTAEEYAALSLRVEREVKEFERAVSLRFSASDFSRLNGAEEGQAVALSPAAYDLAVRAEELSALTGGAFDPSVGALVELWGFDSANEGKYSKPRKSPAEEEISDLLARAAESSLLLEEGRATKTGGAKYDYGGIAKGYLAEKIADVLRETGVTDGGVSLMSNHYLLGKKKEGDSARAWRVGIRDPRNPASECLTFELTDGGATTSGDYERCYVYGQKRYCHIIDPATGAPADKGVMSATVVSEDGALGDALATAAFSLGAKKTLELAESLGVKAVVICTDYRYYATEGFDVRPSSEVYEGYPACAYARGAREDAPDVATAAEAELALYRKKSRIGEWIVSGVAVAAAAGLIVFLIVKKK